MIAPVSTAICGERYDYNSKNIEVEPDCGGN